MRYLENVITGMGIATAVSVVAGLQSHASAIITIVGLIVWLVACAWKIIRLPR